MVLASVEFLVKAHVSASSFTVESLESRVLLSADVAQVLVVGLTDVVSIYATVEHAAALTGYTVPVASAMLAEAYDPSAQLDGLFDCLSAVETTAPTAPDPMLDDLSDTAASLASGDASSMTGVLDYGSVSAALGSLLFAAAERDNLTASDGAGCIESTEWAVCAEVIEPAVLVEGTGSLTARLVETLQAPNAPPASSPFILSGLRAPSFAQPEQIVLDPADPVVNGTVRDSVSNLPLAGITVTAYAINDPWHPVASGLTNASGAFSINWIGGGDFVFHFEDTSGSHYSTWLGNRPIVEAGTVLTLAGGETRNGSDALLTPSARIRGVVSDSVSGLPIAGVNITARPEFGGPALDDTAITAADGSYVFGALSAGSYVLSYSGAAAHHLSAESAVLTVASSATLAGVNQALAADAPISGRVTDTLGADLSGVRVIVHPSTSEGGISAETLTAADGTYRVGGLAAGDYKVEFRYGVSSVWSGGAAFASATVLSPTAAAPVTGLNATFTRAGSISGLLVTGDGIGLPGEQVYLYPSDNQSSSVAILTTDSSGAYTAPGLAAGDYKLRFYGWENGYLGAWHGGADFASATVITLAAGQNLIGLTTSLVRGAIIYGRITAEVVGAPVVNARVAVLDSASEWMWAGMDETDAQGYYVIRGLVSGDFKMKFQPDWDDAVGYMTEYYDNKASFATGGLVAVTGSTTQEINAQLGVGGSVTGLVRDADGNPVTGVAVYAYSNDNDWNTLASATSAADGTFHLTGLASAPLRIQFNVYAPSTSVGEWYDNADTWATATPVTVTLGSETNLGVIQLARAATINGTLTAPGGSPVAGAIVRLYPGVSQYDWEYTTTATTDALGHYTLVVFNPGDYKLQFRGTVAGYGTEYYNDQFTLAAATLVSVSSGEQKAGIDAVLTPMAGVSGRVVESLTGIGVAGVTVTLSDVSSYWLSSTATTNANGDYTVFYNAVTPSLMRLSFDHADYFIQYYNGKADSSSADSITITPQVRVTGYDVSLVRGATITGTVTAATSPVAGATVYLYAAGNLASYLTYTYTDSSYGTGAFAFRRLSPGDYVLRYEHASYVGEWFDNSATGPAATVITLAAGASTVANADLAVGGRIEGKVTAGPSDTALSGATVAVYDQNQTLVRSASTDASGNYSLTGLASGIYRVQFSRYGYVTEWYGDVPDFASSVIVNVTAPAATSGINLHLNAPNLTIEDFIVPSFAAISGPSVVSWTVRNTGDADASADWYDRVFLSNDTSLNTYFDSFAGYADASAQSPLAPGASYTFTRIITIPSDLGTGAKYLILFADSYQSQVETSDADNLVSRAITLGAPDLSVTAATAPATASGGQSVIISFTVQNVGADPATATWWDAVYLSTDSTYDTGDTWLYSASSSSRVPLAAGASYTLDSSVTIPATATGNRYLLFVADSYNAQAETNEANNTRAVAVSLNAPDLTLSDPVAPGTAVLGELVTLGWRVTNTGVYSAPALWSDRVYLSTDTLLDLATDTLVYAYSASAHTGLVPSAAYDFSITARLPEFASTGAVYLLFVTDALNQQGETDEANNLQTLAITLSAPDLAVTALTAPASALLSETLTVSWTVRNNGLVAAPLTGWSDSLYLSRSATLDASSVLVATESITSPHTPLAASASYTVTREVVIPAGLVLGDWQWIVVTDSARMQGETNETNNARAAAVTLAAPRSRSHRRRRLRHRGHRRHALALVDGYQSGRPPRPRRLV